MSLVNDDITVSQASRPEDVPRAARPGLSPSDWLFVILAAYVVFSCVYNAYAHNSNFFHNHDIAALSRYTISRDVDQIKITTDVGEVHSFAGTLKWWHSSWCGYGKYWRPLTCLGFWLEDKAFTVKRIDLWQLSLMTFHLIFSGLLYVFSLRISGNRWTALVAVFLFAGSTDLFPISLLASTAFGGVTHELHFEAAANVALINWIDQPEMWFGSTALLAMTFALEKRWIPALIFAALGTCFKEVAWLTFPMVLALLALSGRLKEMPKWVWTASFVEVAIMLGLRATAGHDVFARHVSASNRSWPVRYYDDVCGFYLRNLFAPNGYFALIPAFWAAIMLWFRRGLAIGLALALGGTYAILALFDPIAGGGVAAEFEAMLDPNCYLNFAIASLIYALIVGLAIQSADARRQMLLVLPLILVSAIATTVDLQFASDHIDYVVHAFQSLLVAIVLVAAAQQAVAKVSFRLSRRTLAEPSPG